MKELCKNCGHVEESHWAGNMWYEPHCNHCDCSGWEPQEPAPKEKIEHWKHGEPCTDKKCWHNNSTPQQKLIDKTTEIFGSEIFTPPPPDIEAYIKDFREKFGYISHFAKFEEINYSDLESFLRHALTEYGDAREEENEKLWTLGSKLSEHDEKIRAEAYERGFQAGHAKERWLKDEVEKEARNAALDSVEKEIAANKERGYNIEAALPGILEKLRKEHGNKN